MAAISKKVQLNILKLTIFGYLLIGWLAPAVADDLSYDQFKTLLLQTKVGTPSEILAKLPVSLRYNYTLMRRSQSLHESSDEQPRAILFGETAQTILTFNGNPKHAGYGAFEISNYDQASKRIHFRKIILRSENPAMKWTNAVDVAAAKGIAEDEIEVFDKRFLVTKPNPMLCMACHAALPRQISELKNQPGEKRLARYLWRPYPNWQGAFGADDDRINPTELEPFNRIKSSHPRYKYLIQNPKVSTYPYYGNDPTKRIVSLMPNLRLTTLLSLRYSEQLASLVMNSKTYLRNPHRIIGHLLSCQEPSDTTKGRLADLQSEIGRLDLNVGANENEFYNVGFDGLFSAYNFKHMLGFQILKYLSPQDEFIKDTLMITVPERDYLSKEDFVHPTRQFFLNQGWFPMAKKSYKDIHGFETKGSAADIKHEQMCNYLLER